MYGVGCRRRHGPKVAEVCCLPVSLLRLRKRATRCGRPLEPTASPRRRLVLLKKVPTTDFLQALRAGGVAAARARKCFHAVTRQMKSSAGCLVGRRSVFRLTGDLPQGVWWVVDSLSLLLSGTLASAGKGTLLHSLFCRGCLGVELLHPTSVSDDRIIWLPVRRGRAFASAMKHDVTS